MKKLFKSMMLVAAAAMGFTACSKDATEEFEPVAQATETITLSTDITRTTLNGDRTQLTWVAGDQFAVYTDQGTKNTPVTYTEGAVNFDIEVALGSQTVYAYYPYFDKQDISYDQTHVSMYVTSTQKQSKAGVFDGNVNDYAMVAKGEIDADRHVSLTFRPVACAMALNIYGGQAGETVQEVTFNPGVVCAGQHLMDITVDNPVYTAAEGKATSVTVTLTEPFEAVGEKPADPKTFANQVYAVVARKAYEGAAFTVKTSLNTYTFKTASTLDLTTDFFTMNLNLAKGETPAPIATKTYAKVTTAPADWTGTYIIAYKDNVMTGAFRAGYENKYLAKDTATAYDEAGNTITCNSAYEITIEKSTTDGYYTLKNSEGKYIGWDSSTNAKFGDTPSTDSFLWKLGITGQTISNKAASARNIRYSSSYDYRVYSGTSNGSAPDFYTISGPNISVTEKVFVIAADDTAEHTFTCTVSGEGAELTDVTLTQDAASKSWLEVTDADGTVTYKASVNETDAPRTATLTLAIADGNSVEITVTQAAPIKKLIVTLSVEGTTASWTANASPVVGYNYTVTADAAGTGEVVKSGENVQETSLDLSTLGLETGTYYLHVQALGDGIATSDSEIVTSEGIAVEKGDAPEYPSYNETFTKWTNANTSNSTSGTEITDVCTWSYTGASTAYWSNISSGSSMTNAITLLKPAKADGTFILSETLQNGIKNIKLTARSNNTGTGVNIYVIDITNQQTHLIGTIKTTTKKKDFTGEFDITDKNITGDYQIKIANINTTAYVCIGNLEWNY